jgi:hypothetical protein
MAVKTVPAPKSYKTLSLTLKATLPEGFAQNSYLIREVGNLKK